MPANGIPYGHRIVAWAFSGLLLTGMAAAPATAESTRDKQWFLTAMKAEGMWRTSKGEGVTVAVLDSGVDPNNADLKGRVLDGKDLAPDEQGDEHTDYSGHGTGIAGLIAATGAYGGHGAFGLAPGAKILPVRLPDPVKSFNGIGWSEKFNKVGPRAIRYAVDSGAKVISISDAVPYDSPQLTAAVDYALKKGSLIFAAVGNDGQDGNAVSYPAATPGVVGVGAIGKDLGVTKESATGSQVDMAAPGEDLIHACGGKTGLCKSHGTGDATALASASAALIWARHPAWTNNQVLRVMLNTLGGPVDGAKRSDYIGYGIVRPRIALKSPGAPGPADRYPLTDYPVVQVTHYPTPKASQAAGGPVAAGQDGGSAPFWVGLGVAAAATIGAAIAVPVVRRRSSNRRRPDAQHPALAPAQMRQQTYPSQPSHTYVSSPGFGPPPPNHVPGPQSGDG
ncbi:type VII secretion-associated serine protease mycosin [Streptomyces sp. NPDC058067]|uniref:type VII secretion-associated serine protease mycosin n=1 Tax=Streptomyces sp. NPDC058067 TaxID=3346324 RepID=UPI0036E7BDE6